MSPYEQPLRVRDMAAGDRPQERLERLGAAALSDTELLAMLLRSGQRGHNVLSIAQKLLAEAGSLPALVRWTAEDFRRVKGIGQVKALQLLAVMEVARRVLARREHVEAPLSNAADVYRCFEARLPALSVEKFWVLCLDRKNRLLREVELTSGTATSTLAHPREVFREAVRHGATALICAHNHPSGDPQPSAADTRLTRQLRDAATAVDIPLLDHVILGQPAADPTGRGYYSFREAGVL